MHTSISVVFAHGLFYGDDTGDSSHSRSLSLGWSDVRVAIDIQPLQMHSFEIYVKCIKLASKLASIHTCAIPLTHLHKI